MVGVVGTPRRMWRAALEPYPNRCLAPTGLRLILTGILSILRSPASHRRVRFLSLRQSVSRVALQFCSGNGNGSFQMPNENVGTAPWDGFVNKGVIG